MRNRSFANDGELLKRGVSMLGAIAVVACELLAEGPPAASKGRVPDVPAVSSPVEEILAARDRDEPAIVRRSLDPAPQNDTGTNGELLVTSPPSPYTSGVLLRSFASTPDLFFRLGTASGASSWTVTNAADASLLKLRGHGSLILGAANDFPTMRFASVNYADGGRSIYSLQHSTIETTTSQHDYGLLAEAYNNPLTGARNNGSAVGLQTHGYNTGPGTVASVFAGRFIGGVSAAATGTVDDAYGLHVIVTKGAGTITNGYGLVINDVAATNDFALYQTGADDTSYFAGRVGIGTSTPTTALHVAGDIYASGSITGALVLGSVYQDVAEWVPSSSDMAPGTVVVLSPDTPNQVMPSAGAYDTTVAGVVSAQPGILLGIAGDDKEQIATTGRVRVRVDATTTPIRIGDLLVTSNKPGMAMRSEPMDLNGRRFHQPGTIIGKALEPLASGEGEILVLLSMQ